ncbi:MULTISPECIES: hypothetical protein [unclassified Acidovorax]|uniref:hypothetical protein n=1 Tax=unclassified Acidovorax TaxID=2684926 RepID=UPI001C45AF6D|nr:MULTISPECIES: hypothetical protein [unclassified Acidovorax]MBV7429813.1 hypothetical protein [Acidovorax sp. sif0732]MBV7448891.1 hypothetical protein [Acidovorax sp. sif0715]
MIKLVLLCALIWGYMCTLLSSWNFSDFILSGLLSFSVIAGISPYFYIRYYNCCVADIEKDGWVLPLMIFLYYILVISFLIVDGDIGSDSLVVLTMGAIYFLRYVDDMAAGIVSTLPPQAEVRLLFKEYPPKRKSDYLPLWWLLIASCLLPWGARLFWSGFSSY